MSNQWNIPIDKLMLWKGNNWTKYETRSCKTTLRIHYDQLMLISDTKLLETFNMNSKMKGIFFEDVLILVIRISGQKIRKLRFQIKSDVAECFQTLREHFPVMSYSGLQSKNEISAKYRNIDDIFKNALDNKETGISVPLPRDYRNFIKLCMLDPAFPQCVSETMKIFQEDILKPK